MQFMDLNEKRQHGTSDFPFAWYHIDRNHPRYIMNYHWHPEFEIIRVLEGELDMTLDERKHRVKRGEMVFVPGGVLHSGNPVNCVYECLVFDLNAFARHNAACSSYIQNIANMSVQVQDHFRSEDDRYISESEAATCRTIHHIIAHVFHAMRDMKPGYEMMVYGEMYHFFAVVFEKHLYRESARQSRKGYRKVLQLRRVLDYMDENYSHTVTLEQLAASASMSPKYFCRFFSQMTHRTPMDYLNYQRIEHACYALSTSDMSVTEAAYSCGFNDLSYFIKTFKKYKGTTPGKYVA